MATIRQRSNSSWQAVIRRKGLPKQSKVFRKQSEAIRWARAVEGDTPKSNIGNLLS